MPIYKQLLEQIEKVAKIGNWELDVATGVTIWSPQIYEIYKIPQGTPINKIKGIEFYAPHERPRLTRSLELSIQEKLPFDETFEFYDSEGTQKWVRSIGSPQVNDQGEVYKIFGIFQDVTYIKSQEREGQFVLAAVKAGVWKWDIKNDILKWDNALYDIFGIDKSQFAGAYEAWQSSLHPDHREEIEADLQKALRGEKEFDTTITILKKDGSTAYLGGRGIVQFDSNGNAVSMYGINWDRTPEVLRQKELEQQKKIAGQASKLASIGQLAAGIGHEVNNPLSIIIGQIEVLESQMSEGSPLDTQGLRQHLSKINQAAERIQKIVRGLKKFSRDSAETQVTFSVQESIQDSLSLVTEMYAKEGIHIEFHRLPGGKEDQILGDPIKFQQVLMNLLTNARDAMQSYHQREIHIQMRRVPGKVSFDFINSGPTIAPQYVDRIFDPFFTTKPIGEGTGIGLYITKNILEAMSGHIELIAEPQTCFRVTLPVALSPIATVATSPEPKSTDDLSALKKSVLLVEDETALATIIAGFLKKAGYAVVTCTSADEALNLIGKAVSFDLILSDAKMPGRSGEDFLLELRRDSRWEKTPFILMSGNMNYEEPESSRSQKAKKQVLPTAFLSKPFRRDELLKLIQDVVSRTS